MRREIALCRAFAKLEMPVVTSPPADRPTWEAVVDLARAIRTIRCAIDVAPSADDTRAMRRRLLEDPTEPTAWIADGLRECARRELR
jgi:hypothetical protein